ncbi:MAG: DUF5916 domain-containing protein [Crocinitomicaceae bacterium]
MKTLFFISFIFLFFQSSLAQNQETLSVSKTETEISIDGIDNEMAWKNAMPSQSFTQTTPNNGKPSIQKTEVKMLYDNEAIYVFATMYEVHSDSITKTLSRRDKFGNADLFGVVIDTYGASTIGFGFLVTAAGVQIDEIHSPNNIDRNWNAVWFSSVKCLDNKWVAELKIPLAAFRFPNQTIQDWKANFTRHIRRNREDSNWQYFDATKLNYLSQFGNLSGIEGLKSPVRLALFPYLSTYVDIFEQNVRPTVNGGMDLKYGMNDAFTLDMTLIPDFGQVRFDDQVLNLSPYEIQFDEFRQFFTEGVELFNKGDLFYSRRLGGTPVNQNRLQNLEASEVIEIEKNTTRLVNATKFSGRTSKGLGVGILNGTSLATKVHINDTLTGSERIIETSPLTNYNVLIFDQNLKHNSSLTLANSNVWRAGETYDANVTAFLFDLFDQSERFNINGNISNSQLFESGNATIGQKYELELGKVAGKFITDASGEIVDEKFNNNDLGFLRRNNYKNISYYAGYRSFEPFWRLIRYWAEIEIEHTRLHQPDNFENLNFYTETGAAFKNFLFAGLNFTWRPLAENDFFEARTANYFYKRPGGTRLGGFISSNYGKPFAYDIRANLLQRNENDRYDYSINLSPRFRFNDKFSLIYDFTYDYQQNDVGLALTNTFDIVKIIEVPIFGQRDRQNITNLLTANYVFNNKMDVSFRARHYWSIVEYKDFYLLEKDGRISNIDYTGYDQEEKSIHDNNFNIFTIDMTYSWVFAPGSFLNIVWKQSLSNTNTKTTLNYFSNVNDLTQSPAFNSISLKLLYYLSYASLKSIKNSN